MDKDYYGMKDEELIKALRERSNDSRDEDEADLLRAAGIRIATLAAKLCAKEREC